MKEIFRAFMRFYRKWSSDNSGIMSAALAFYSIFSAVPAIVVIISAAGILLGEDVVSRQFFAQADLFLGHETSESLKSLVDKWQPSSYFGLNMGVIFLVIGATGIFSLARSSLNTIFRANSRGGLIQAIRKRMVSFAILAVVGIVVLFLVMFGALSAKFANVFNIAWFSRTVDFFIFLGASVLLFALIYRILPETRMPLKGIWKGSLVAGLMLGIGRYLISVYISKSTIASSFGAASFIVVMLLWIYYASMILFIGGQIVYFCSKEGTKR
jgi:membrane protein